MQLFDEKVRLRAHCEKHFRRYNAYSDIDALVVELGDFESAGGGIGTLEKFRKCVERSETIFLIHFDRLRMNFEQSLYDLESEIAFLAVVFEEHAQDKGRVDEKNVFFLNGFQDQNIGDFFPLDRLKMVENLIQQGVHCLEIDVMHNLE